MKHLLKLMDFSTEEIVEVLDLADKLKYEKKNGIKHHLLEGKTLGMIFSKEIDPLPYSSLPMAFRSS